MKPTSAKIPSLRPAFRYRLKLRSRRFITSTKTVVFAGLWLIISTELSSEVVIDRDSINTLDHSESKVNLELLQYSKVFQSTTSLPRRTSKPVRTQNTNGFDDPHYPHGAQLYFQENCFSIDFNETCDDGEYSPGAALGKLLRLSFKAWWRNLPPTKLHRIEEATPEVIKTGNFNGSTQNNWDYSFKLSGDKVKFQLEREFQ